MFMAEITKKNFELTKKFGPEILSIEINQLQLTFHTRLVSKQ